MYDSNSEPESTRSTDRLLNRILGLTLLLINNIDTFTTEQQLEALQVIYESAQELNEYLQS